MRDGQPQNKTSHVKFTTALYLQKKTKKRNLKKTTWLSSRFMTITSKWQTLNIVEIIISLVVVLVVEVVLRQPTTRELTSQLLTSLFFAETFPVKLNRKWRQLHRSSGQFSHIVCLCVCRCPCEREPRWSRMLWGSAVSGEYPKKAVTSRSSWPQFNRT